MPAPSERGAEFGYSPMPSAGARILVWGVPGRLVGKDWPEEGGLGGGA